MAKRGGGKPRGKEPDRAARGSDASPKDIGAAVAIALDDGAADTLEAAPSPQSDNVQTPRPLTFAQVATPKLMTEEDEVLAPLPPPKPTSSALTLASDTVSVEQTSSPDLDPPQVRTFNVYITGFGSWGRVATNPAHLIASSLPDVLAAKFLANNNPLPAGGIRVNIIPHNGPIPVSYVGVDEVIPAIHSRKDIDLFVHLGVSNRVGYQIEKIARRRPYEKKDGTGHFIDETEPKSEENEGGTNGNRREMAQDDHAAEKQPDKFTGIIPDKTRQVRCGADLDNVVRRFQNYKNGQGLEKVQEPTVSYNAGLFLCEYIYFVSLCQAIYKDPTISPKPFPVCERQIMEKYTLQPNTRAATQRPDITASRRVVFIHVPQGIEEVQLEVGRDTIQMIIGGLVLSSVAGVYW